MEPVGRNETLREARARYFEANGFGPDGGYFKTWEIFKLGPLPIPIPNPPARRRAIEYHDCNHVLTGYATDWRGEFEISAWELGAGCGEHAFAWMINLGGMAMGLLLQPRRTLAAFERGRGCRSLYDLPLEEVLDLRVGDARRLVGLES